MCQDVRQVIRLRKVERRRNSYTVERDLICIFFFIFFQQFLHRILFGRD